MKRDAATKFATEADLCAAFIAALPKGYTAYPETGDWDILLVRPVDGFQIGVQAKLRLNNAVLVQALEHRYRAHDEGPDCRAVLVPEGKAVAGCADIAEHLALTVIQMRAWPEHSFRYNARFTPSLPAPENRFADESDWFEMCPRHRVRLPAYVPDAKAGTSSPLQLTEWKIKAIKIAVLLEHRGFVTRTEFKALRIDPRRWIENGWLVASERGLVPGTIPDFKGQHPRNYAEIAADFEKWEPGVVAAAVLP